MSAFQKDLEDDDLADRHLSARALQVKYMVRGKGQHPIFHRLDWLQARLEGDPQACVPYWEWVARMCQRTDLDPADTRAALFD